MEATVEILGTNLYALSAENHSRIVINVATTSNGQGKNNMYLCQLITKNGKYRILVEGKNLTAHFRKGFEPYDNTIVYSESIEVDGIEGVVAFIGENGNLVPYTEDEILSEILKPHREKGKPAIKVKTPKGTKTLIYDEDYGFVETLHVGGQSEKYIVKNVAVCLSAVPQL